MAISLNCLTEALEPFMPRLNDLHIDDWTNPQRLLAKAAATQYGLSPGEAFLFDQWWKLSSGARDLAQHGSGADLDAEIRAAFTRLAAIVNDGAEFTERGYRYVHRRPGDGRFVIFSDHHMAFAGSRQDFFSKNRVLYQEILSEYAEAGFTLIENGDVEELVIHEPMLPPPPSPGDLEEVREAWRPLQLAQVIANYKDLYEQINAQFVEEGRYIRLAGNHDQDTQDAPFFEKLREVYPKLEQVYDFLILEPAGGNGPTFVVGHGHHFDKVSNPKYSGQIGETLSESLGWAFEGADRVWRWDRPDGVKNWASGKEGFRNNLVTDDHESFKFTFGDVVETSLATYLGGVIGSLVGLAILGGATGMAASLVDELSDPAFWESLYRHNIAWEYFQNSDPGEAILKEVFCGERWIKARHLDEVFIHQQLEGVFGAKTPYLVLGHSHEPRHQALVPAGPGGKAGLAEHYLNSGAAGRFENLIWGVEISDGVPQVVAWHRPGGPASGEAAERRTYTPVSNPARVLIASERHIPLPRAEEEAGQWVAPVLHMMMAPGP
jgi:hypothetical protein